MSSSKYKLIFQVAIKQEVISDSDVELVSDSGIESPMHNPLPLPPRFKAKLGVRKASTSTPSSNSSPRPIQRYEVIGIGILSHI